LKICEDITFTGFKKNPYRWMKYADLFILSSRYEGFPNAVLESMACGTPVIAFECPGGLNEIVIEGINGALVENGDTDLLAAKINYFAQVVFDRQEIINNILKRYSCEKIICKYAKMFNKVMNGDNE